MAGIMEKLQNLEQMIKYSHDMKIEEVRTKNPKMLKVDEYSFTWISFCATV